MIVIKDMEMPKNCYACRLTYYDEAMNRRCSKTKRVVEFIEKADDCPLVEIEERKIGKWIGEKVYPICGKCGCDVIGEYISKTEYAEMYKSMKFCPNCGAEMRGDESD